MRFEGLCLTATVVVRTALAPTIVACPRSLISHGCWTRCQDFGSGSEAPPAPTPQLLMTSTGFSLTFHWINSMCIPRTEWCSVCSVVAAHHMLVMWIGNRKNRNLVFFNEIAIISALSVASMRSKSMLNRNGGGGGCGGIRSSLQHGLSSVAWDR